MRNFICVLSLCVAPVLCGQYVPRPASNGEPAAGNPASDGYLWSSTAAGVRSWKDPGTLIITQLTDGSDSTKHFTLDISGVTTGTTRTLTFPNANGTLALTSDIPSGATSAQTITQTSTTTRLTPANIPFALFGMNWRPLIAAYGAATFFTGNATTGTGSTGTGNDGAIEVASGVTASSYGRRDTGNNVSGLSPSTSALTAGLNFDKMIGFTATIRPAAGTTNGTSRLSFGNTFGADGSGTTSKLAGKGIGVEIRNATLWGAVHDGSTYSAATLSTTLTANAYTTVTVFRSASGSFDYYINGTYAATLTGGPTGTNTSHVCKFSIGVDNNADAANQDFYLIDCKLFQAL